LTIIAAAGSLCASERNRKMQMGVSISLDLTDRDLGFFRYAIRKSRNAVRDADEQEIIEAIQSVIDVIKVEDPLPDFVARRLPDLDAMIAMLQDREWRLPRLDRERMLATFVYFGDPEDIIPDDIPAIGYLDDVILIELLLRDLRHVREAYVDFCDYRDHYDERFPDDPDPASRQKRINDRRKQLHARMKRRQRRDRTPALWGRTKATS
jgi:uncharacterized membrane protein YkvA (DUF1232 family)